MIFFIVLIAFGFYIIQFLFVFLHLLFDTYDFKTKRYFLFWLIPFIPLIFFGIKGLLKLFKELFTCGYNNFKDLK